MEEAFKTYVKEVSEGVFPAPDHEFKISEEVISKLY